MRRRELGFTTIELVVAFTVAAVIASATASATFQILHGTRRSNSHLAAISQVQNASYWISRDTQIANGGTTDNLSANQLLALTWTEHDFDAGTSVYHSVTYTFTDLIDHIGNLKRTYWSSGGANTSTLVGTYLYYNPADSDNTSTASYDDPELTLRLAARSGQSSEIRQYKINRRTNL